MSSNLVIAGIIDTRNGEIIETLTRPGNKTALRLKVRDELNKEQGANTFISFELDSCIGINLDFIKRQLKTDNHACINELKRYRALINIERYQKGLEGIAANIAKTEVVYNTCLAAFDETDSASRELVEDAFESSFTDLREQEAEVKHSLRREKEILAKL
ncbi:hypothetical protein [Neptuniibacter sp. QD37_11]|uniref:hypothetical protein n=1 Tax=Neptuniibacter sp. QD37_11 TaxID=3398209 RepID=UPI0039F5AA23